MECGAGGLEEKRIINAPGRVGQRQVVPFAPPSRHVQAGAARRELNTGEIAANQYLFVPRPAQPRSMELRGAPDGEYQEGIVTQISHRG